METETKVGIPLATVPTVAALTVAYWKKPPAPSVTRVTEVSKMVPAAGEEKSASIEELYFPPDFKTGEKKSFTLKGHIDKGTIKLALGLGNDEGNPGPLHILVGGKEYEILPGHGIGSHTQDEHGPCTRAEMSKAWFEKEGTYRILAGAGYWTGEDFKWTDADSARVTVKKAPFKIPTWGWILGGTAVVGIAGMILTKAK